MARALASMRSGFLVAAGNGIISPPAAVTSGASRPGSASTSARPPARTTAAAISTADRSAPPVSRRGMICSMVGRLYATVALPPNAGLRGFIRMDDTQPQFLDVGSGPDRRRIAYLRQPGRHPEKPSLMFLSGFKSQMRAVKADAVAQWAAERGIGCLRFDYSGHGQSEGRFEDGTLSRWLEETRAVFERQTEGPQVLIGSSMGGHIALLLLRRCWPRRRRRPRASRAWC